MENYNNLQSYKSIDESILAYKAKMENLTKNINSNDLPDYVGYVSVTPNSCPIGTNCGDWAVEVEGADTSKEYIISASDILGFYEVSVREETSIGGKPYIWNRTIHKKGKVKLKYTGPLDIYNKYR